LPAIRKISDGDPTDALDSMWQKDSVLIQVVWVAQQVQSSLQSLEYNLCSGQLATSWNEDNI